MLQELFAVGCCGRGAGVGYGEGAVGLGGEFDGVGCVGALWVGDVFGFGVVGGCTFGGVVKLVEVFEARGVEHGIEDGDGAAFGLAVVHDGDAGVQSVKEDGA